MEGDRIKRATFLIIFVMIISIFAGCGKTPDVAVPENAASPFSIYRREDGYVISIGDTRDEVAPVLGPDEMHVIEFVEENTERVQYWDNEQVFIEYNMEDGKVCAMRFTIDEWKIFNDLTVGMTTEDVKSKYPEEHLFSFPETSDIWIAYDEAGNSMEFADTAPYIVRFRIKENKIDLVMIQDNTLRGGLF